MSNEKLESVANRIARETMEVWETHVRQGQQAVVESHQESFSAFAGVRIPSEGCTVTEHLIDLLGDEDQSARQAAAKAIGIADTSSQEAVEALVEQLKVNESLWNQLETAKALGQIGRSDPAVIEALFARLIFGEHWSVQRVFAEALEKIANSDPAVRRHVFEMLLNRISDDDPLMRVRAARALGWAAQTFNLTGKTRSVAVEVLIDRLEDKDESVRRAAATSLGRSGPSDSEAVESLLTRFEDDVMSVRRASVAALGKISSADSRVVEALLERLEVKDSALHRETTNVLEECLPKLELSVGRFMRDYRKMREAAARALGMVGCSDPTVLETLINRLEDEHWSVRRASAEALRRIGDSDQTIVEALEKRLGDGNVEVCVAAAEALERLDVSSPPVEEPLINFLEGGESERVRRIAAEALGQVAPSTSKVKKALATRFLDESEGLAVRRRAGEALVRIGLSDPAVATAFAERLGDENRKVNQEAARAISQIPWHVFPADRTNEEAEVRLVEKQEDGVIQTGDGEHLLVSKWAMARLPR